MTLGGPYATQLTQGMRGQVSLFAAASIYPRQPSCQEKQLGTAGGSPLRPLCSRLPEAIGKQATAGAKLSSTEYLAY